MDPKTLAITIGAAIGGFIVGLIVGRCSCQSAGEVATEEGDGIELYVGNLSYDISEKELKKAFGAHGSVVSARIITNKFNNRSKGYGFIEMANQGGADKAVKAMHGKELKGRKLVVNEARSRSRD
jgi:RNA recognition motif-containing protein